jgi:hypothetical protein
MILRRAVLALALVSIPAVATAQPSDADKDTARALAQEGQDALDRRDFTTASDRFGRAGKLVHAPTLTLGLARAQVGLGKLVLAQEIYESVLREELPPGAPPAFVKAITDAKRELDTLKPRIPGVIISVSGASSARVSLDGAPVPSAWLGMSRPVDPGRHVVRADAEGFAPAESTVTVVEHKTEKVALTLVPGAATAPPGGPPPSASGGSTRRTLGFAALGVGGAGLLVGAIIGGVEVAKHGELSKNCPGSQCPPSEYGTLDSYHSLSNVPVVGFALGGVLAATGVALVVTAPKAGPASEAWLAPLIGPGFAGLKGRF